MRKFLLLLCLLIPDFAYSEEIKITLDMSYDKAIELLQKCGAEDVTERKPNFPRTSSLYWRLDRYDVQVAIGEHYGKVNRLSYWMKRDVGLDKSHEEENERIAQSLTFDTEAQTFSSKDSLSAQRTSLGERWNVRVEVLIVSMPQVKVLSLLPDLRDEAKIEGAYTQIIEAIQHDEAKLVGYPMTYALSGDKATSETILEKLYPTQYQPPQVPQNFGNTTTVTTTTTTVSDDTKNGYIDAVPSNFEKRNVGVTLETAATVRDAGKLIQLDLEPQHVELEGFDSYESSKVSGVTVKVEQPRFSTRKQNGSLLIRNGQRMLLGMHQTNQPGQMELYILQASAALVGD